MIYIYMSKYKYQVVFKHPVHLLLEKSGYGSV